MVEDKENEITLEWLEDMLIEVFFKKRTYLEDDYEIVNETELDCGKIFARFTKEVNNDLKKK